MNSDAQEGRETVVLTAIRPGALNNQLLVDLRAHPPAGVVGRYTGAQITWPRACSRKRDVEHVGMVGHVGSEKAGCDMSVQISPATLSLVAFMWSEDRK